MDKLTYWHYYTAIESYLLDAAHYVELARHNENTFSIGFAHIILSSGSEIDVLCRLLRGFSGKRTNIVEHRRKLRKLFPRFYSMKVKVSRTDWHLRPWKAWRSDENENPP